MPPVKSLALGLLALWALSMPAEGAGTRWWAWSRAWRAPAYSTLDAELASANPATVTAETVPAAQSTETPLYAIQGSWTPVPELPDSIPLLNIPTPMTGLVSPGTGVSSLEPTGLGLAGGPAVAFSAGYVPSYTHDAYIDLDEGPYAAEDMLTDGGAKPWYLSPVVAKAFGGVPGTDQQAAFSSAVLRQVEQAFLRSGVPNVALTTDPNASAAHTLSVVSGTQYGPNPEAIGITNMGGDGFSFIDKLSYADSVDELQRAVANNVAHELMHAFGVEHHDSTGRFLDSATAPWEVLVDPDTVFSTEATADLLAQDFRRRYDTGYGFGAQHVGQAMGVSPSPVPEPTTWALWCLATAGAWVFRRSRGRGRRRDA